MAELELLTLLAAGRGVVLGAASAGWAGYCTSPRAAVDWPARAACCISAARPKSSRRTLDLEKRTKLERLEIRKLARLRLASGRASQAPRAKYRVPAS
jgi:hypothetical protein